MNKGLDFEDKIINILKNKFNNDVTSIINKSSDFSYDQMENLASKTLDEMKKGTPFIYQGVVINNNKDSKYYKTFGIPDLIVRCDYLNKLVNSTMYPVPTTFYKDEKITNEVANEIIKQPAQKINLNTHYRVVDIKFTTLNLCSNATTILNNGSFPAYKSQLLIYNQALGEMQGYFPNEAYILGHRWKYTKSGNNYSNHNAFDKLGVVYYDGFDKQYLSKTIDGINWIRDLRQKGHQWKILPKPTRYELYPNMCNTNDTKWSDVKENISQELNEITVLWQCGPKNREIAHRRKIYKWSDKKCTAKSLGVKGDVNGPKLQAILNINQANDGKLITNPIKNNINDWQNKPALEFFVDFETINNIFGSFDVHNGSETMDITLDGVNMIFMIGVGYENENDEWIYKSFIAEKLDHKSECEMIKNFYNYLRKITNIYIGEDSEIPLLYHWGHAENTQFNTAQLRHNNIFNKLQWFDFLTVFKSEPIVVKGAFKFGLKEISNAMYNNGMINTIWNKNNKCSNGNDAMMYAFNAYIESENNNSNINDNNNMKDIIEYNEIDCKVICEIVNYLRDNN
jgi:hypothetical protein